MQVQPNGAGLESIPLEPLLELSTHSPGRPPTAPGATPASKINAAGGTNPGGSAPPPTPIAVIDSVRLSLPAQAAASVPVAKDVAATDLVTQVDASSLSPLLRTASSVAAAQVNPSGGVESSAGAIPAPQAPVHDVVTALVTQIASPDTARLSAMIQPLRSLEFAANIASLAQNATLAVQEGDSARALSNLTAIAGADPHNLLLLAPDPAFHPIRPQLDQLLNHMTTLAKMDAEGWLAKADDAIATPGYAAAAHWQTKPEVLLNVAHRLFDSGGYTNYTLSTGLSQTILNYSPIAYSPFLDQFAQGLNINSTISPVRPEDDELLQMKPKLATVQQTFTAVRAAAKPRLQMLWRRAPLLVLLLSWLGLGLVFGPVSILLRTISPYSSSLIDFGFEVWGLGFLALVGFGFYARIRDIRA